jgi:hypothetical protein
MAGRKIDREPGSVKHRGNRVYGHSPSGQDEDDPDRRRPQKCFDRLRRLGASDQQEDNPSLRTMD